MYELSGLRELDSSLDENDWPCLELHDATIWSANETLVDLMDVSEHGPFVVKGWIKKNDPGIQKGMVKNPNVFKTPVRIVKVYSYSIETMEDGSHKIWALGRAAWYHIKPAPDYKVFYQQMMKKARLWTFTEEQYMDALDKLAANPKKKIKLTPTFDQLCGKYAALDNKHCRFPFSARKWYKDVFRRFIIVMMLENIMVTNRDWTKTPIYAFYQDYCPDTIQELKQTLNRQKWRKRFDLSSTDEPESEPAPSESRRQTQPEEARVKEESDFEGEGTITVCRRRSTGRRSKKATTSTPKANTASVQKPKYQSRRAKRIKREEEDVLESPQPTLVSASPFPESTLSPYPLPLPSLRSLKRRRWDMDDGDSLTSNSPDRAADPLPTAAKSKSTLRPFGLPSRSPSPLIHYSRSISPFPSATERLQKLKLLFERQEAEELAHEEYWSLVKNSKTVGAFTAYQYPSTEPNENGHWQCAYGGGKCCFAVEHAWNLTGLQTIEGHMNGHYREMRKILGVIGDESIGELPDISHLISKVERLAETLTPQKPIPPEHTLWDFCR
ncbi:hypothetical protein EX30DRAFT_338734 [Ascodesmis nigricans]|uniref:RFTS domain-containing protein n=1 Tax=Ascodesmis nigricans TaxID=341454 RepID=A0A4S2N4J1_9PEZI|nr:hypothetical protein EX30DRAFT_338734 [Ascodesmis nigricans]